MKKTELLLKKIKAQARIDARNRRDRRFLDTLGFLAAKGFLKTNIAVQLVPNKRLRIDDVIWAGRNVEPRILEVLPAAVIRLQAHFDFDSGKHVELARVTGALRKGETVGADFFGIPFEKLKAWVDLPLPDRRTKILKDKKVTKHFRLSPGVIQKLEERAILLKCSQTEVLERAVGAL